VETPVEPGLVIEVVRITTAFIDEDQLLPYETVWEPTDTLELDTEGLLVPGTEGILRRRWQVTYANGNEIERTLTEEWVAQEPVAELMGYGTNIVVRVLDTDEGSLPYWRKVRMRVTSYTASSAGRPPDHPDYGRTASGYVAQQGIVAVDPRIVPFGSWVYVPGYGISFAGDTGGGVLGRWIDLGYDEASFVPWSGYVDVYYLTPVPRPERITYRLPAELP
jgi:3D (Asp-Asp-Asp) domain-containing protein